MILITYGMHRMEGIAYLIAKVIEGLNEDPYFDFMDLSEVPDKDEKALGRAIKKKCEEMGKVEAIIDIHDTHLFTHFERSDLEYSHFQILTPTGVEQPYKLDEFLNHSFDWPLKLKKLKRQLSDTNVLPGWKLKRTKYMGKYKNRSMTFEIFFFYGNIDNKEIIEEIDKKEYELEDLPEDEERERWTEVLELEAEFLSRNMDAVEILDEIREDIQKLLKIMKKRLE